MTKSYIDKNTEQKLIFEKDFFKQINNSVFKKKIEKMFKNIGTLNL